MTRIPKEDFAKWAASYQGMDGGNPESKLWFCGIEYGGVDNSALLEFVDDNPKNWIKWQELHGNRLPYLLAKTEAGEVKEEMKVGGPFGISQAKIASRFYDEKIETWKQLSGAEGKCFKMNLYPLAFRAYDDSLWEKGHFMKTGFISKSEYKTWCLNYRFPLLKRLIAKYSPKILICFGISLRSEYLTAFCDKDEDVFEPLTKKPIGNEEDKSKRILESRQINGGKTLLLIVPFPSGAYGLNSNALLEQVADVAQTLLKVE